jgi:hypothetical protein
LSYVGYFGAGVGIGGSTIVGGVGSLIFSTISTGGITGGITGGTGS